MNVHDLLKTEDGKLLRVLSIKEDKTLVIKSGRGEEGASGENDMMW